MKLRNYMLLICILCGFIISGCSEEMPVNTDGNTKLTLKVFWNSKDTLLPLSNAKVILTSEYGVMINYTNESGELEISGLPSSIYNISVRRSLSYDNSIIIAGSLLNLKLLSGAGEIIDTIFAKPVSGSGLCLNEIFFSGSVNNQFYFYDQFIEIYNASDSIKYLDGLMIMRFTGNILSEGHKGPGADEDSDNDIDGATYVFRFPGMSGGSQYPINPKQFITLASDAVDHSTMSSRSLDLSHADWEFYNQFSPDDLDNPAVPNLRNMRADKTVDFLISLTSDVIILSSGKDSVWTDGIDASSVLDGIEYQTSNSSNKTLDAHIDRSFIISPSRYSGKSIQRREPGVDTNDSMLDWEIIKAPTPGYQ